MSQPKLNQAGHFLLQEYQKRLSKIEILTDLTIVFGYKDVKMLGRCHHGKPLKGYETSGNKLIFGCEMYTKSGRCDIDYCRYQTDVRTSGLSYKSGVWFDQDQLEYMSQFLTYVNYKDRATLGQKDLLEPFTKIRIKK